MTRPSNETSIDTADDVARRSGTDGGSSCSVCGGRWAISSGPGRVVGAVARSLPGVFAPLPDNFTFEYCPPCKRRNMTPELEQRFLAVEAVYRAAAPKKVEESR